MTTTNQSILPASIVTDLDPLIITSPVPRSGTTLLQRLLCSSRNTLIYGEKCAYDLEFFLNIYTYKLQEYRFQREKSQQDLERVLGGEVNDWVLNLTPNVDGYLASLQKAAFAGVTYSRDYARSVDRPIWGFKYPGWTPGIIQLLKEYMPKARFIYIYRDLLPTLKSAKAQYLVTTEQEVREFCQKWSTGMSYFSKAAGDASFLGISFDALIKQPEDTLNRIADFSGVHQMDKSVLNHKINIWTGQNFTTQTQDGYIEPSELDALELSIVNEFSDTVSPV